MNNLRKNENPSPKKHCDTCKHSYRTFFSHTIVLRCNIHEKIVKYGETCPKYEPKKVKVF